jgi:hypothetical protein
MSDIDTSNYVVMAYTGNYWATGKQTTPYDTIVDRLRRHCGSRHVTKHGCILYLVHPDFEVCGVTGDVFTPTGHPAIKLEDRRPVTWVRMSRGSIFGSLPGGREARLVEDNGTPLGRMIWIEVDGRQIGSVGGGDPRTLLKRAKAEAEKALKLDRQPKPESD